MASPISRQWDEIDAARGEMRAAMQQSQRWSESEGEGWSPGEAASHVIANEVRYAQLIADGCGFDRVESALDMTGGGAGKFAPALVFASSAEAVAAFDAAVALADNVLARINPRHLDRRVKIGTRGTVGRLLGIWPRHLRSHLSQFNAGGDG